jgi:hypothetical protein
MVEVPEKLIKSPDFNREAYRTTTLLHFPQKPNGKRARRRIFLPQRHRGHGVPEMNLGIVIAVR